MSLVPQAVPGTISVCEVALALTPIFFKRFKRRARFCIALIRNSPPPVRSSTSGGRVNSQDLHLFRCPDFVPSQMEGDPIGYCYFGRRDLPFCFRHGQVASQFERTDESFGGLDNYASNGAGLSNDKDRIIVDINLRGTNLRR